ncbi:hypothetical protein P3X46_022262 [Hevea brasiliensis]|uniref:Reverse transcriptase zinc-binding domain-containing protein n=1 Tax=Hevea brasiliensis TaxID=3981 RepID=A0ABQ9L787_HEVBR|nr:hypothetical protein P3X46_022262 [Hevea brasiliensis]
MPVGREIVDDCVACYVASDGGWDLNKLRNLLPQEVIDLLTELPAPSMNQEEDDFFWGEGSKLRSMIWKWPGMQRVKSFLWLVANNGLLTNATRVRRHINSDSSCHICGEKEESILHALRDCL